jgi:hypothetical protein
LLLLLLFLLLLLLLLLLFEIHRTSEKNALRQWDLPAR